MKYWLEMNLIITISFIFYLAFKKLFKLKNLHKFESDLFKVLPLFFLIPLFTNISPVETYVSPIIKKRMQNIIIPQKEMIEDYKIIISQKNKKSSDLVQFGFEELLIFLIFLGILFWIRSLFIDIRSIRNILKSATPIKAYKSVKILFCPDLKIPCSLWAPKNHLVLLPEEILINKTNFYHALGHELQHHRQGDTKLIFIIELIKGIFFINPFTHLWIKKFYENREIKCDKEVIKRKDFEVESYGNTLIEVLNSSSGKVLNRTWAMASLSIIKRRIIMITSTKKERVLPLKGILCSGLLFILTWQTLAATKNITTQKKLTISQANELIENLESKIPVEVNRTVLKWLNYFLTNRNGQAFMIKAIEKMHQYKPFLSEKLRNHDMPLELLAVPLMESGYSNSRRSMMGAAGIWQFMPQTARNFGLRVDAKKDERLDIDKLTGAAIRYYNHLRSIRFFEDDWRLALLAYNTGEGNLIKAMKKTGTKDPWKFNSLGDQDYLAKIMAGMIILKNPKSKFIVRPLQFGRTTSHFGKRKSSRRPGKVFHSGVDIAAKLGTPIYSPLQGKVTVAKFIKGYGNSVIIDHGNKIVTRYHHLNAILVKTGQSVEKEEEIGQVGSSGISSGPHLHFELLLNGKKVDPEIFF